MKFDSIKNAFRENFAMALDIDWAKTANLLMFIKKNKFHPPPRIGCLRIQPVSFRELQKHSTIRRNCIGLQLHLSAKQPTNLFTDSCAA